MSKEEKRLDILNAAIKIFSKYGIHKAKIEDIAKEAGVGKGTIYEYFDSKKDLFQEVVKYGLELYKKDMMETFHREEPIRDKLVSFCSSHGKFISEHVDMAQNIASQTGVLSKEMRCWMAECRIELGKAVIEVLKKGVENGELRNDLDLEVASYAIFGTINQYYSKKIFFDNERYEDIDPAPIVDTLFRGFKNDSLKNNKNQG